MFEPLRQKSRQAPASTMRTLPAPVRGWNARDSIAAMKPDEALVLDNWFPEASEVVLRDGYEAHRGGGSDAVFSLMAYHGQTGTNKLFAASGTAIYDVTSASGSWPSAAVSSTVNAKWQHVQVGTTAGQYLICCNGAVNPRRYDGSSWVDMDNTVLSGSADQTKFIHVNHFKTFVFFVEDASMSVWYLPAGSVGGAEVELDLGGLFKLGGYLMAMGTWTLDAGEGVDDHAVFVTSKGEVAVYKGTDPANASTWALVGVWRLAPPIGRRCFIKTAGDLVLLTTDGFLPLSKALMGGQLKPEIALSDRIRTVLAEAVRTYGSNYGWQPVFYPPGPALVFNIPLTSSASTAYSHQYVMNTLTGAWCRFTGWNAYCFELFNDALYFGGVGVVRKAWSGRSDNSTNIAGDAKHSFYNYGAPGVEKHFTMARPTIQTDGSPGVLIGMNVDYEDSAPVGVLNANPLTLAQWGTLVWGGGVWGGGLRTSQEWQGLEAIGTAGAFRMRVATKDSRVRWSATDIVYERGGIL